MKILTKTTQITKSLIKIDNKFIYLKISIGTGIGSQEQQIFLMFPVNKNRFSNYVIHSPTKCKHQKFKFSKNFRKKKAKKALKRSTLKIDEDI